MTLTRQFDYEDYRKQFRAACARRGIDPLYGASGYQVANLRAEQRRAEWKAAQQRGWGQVAWWQKHELWLNCPPYRSETEQEAIWQVFRQAYVMLALRIVRAIRVRRAAMSLRELHEYQARRK
jgi:hypothetical protein